eukprot:2228587-Alexandrium_andersonii.AAC.1
MSASLVGSEMCIRDRPRPGLGLSLRLGLGLGLSLGRRGAPGLGAPPPVRMQLPGLAADAAGGRRVSTLLRVAASAAATLATSAPRLSLIHI